MSDLKPCPFCGNKEPEIERFGTHRQSCIVACGSCGARHESSDEGEDSGTSWNHRAQSSTPNPVEVGTTVPLLSDAEVDAAIPHPTTFSQSEPAWNSSDMRILRTTARAIEQAVRAKLGVAVPSDVVRRRAIREVADKLETLRTSAHFIFNNPPGNASQDVRDVIEWYAGSIIADIDAAIAAQGAKT